MFQDLTFECRVQRHEDSAQIVQGKEREDRFLAIKHPNRDVITAPNTGSSKATCQLADADQQVTVGPLLAVLEDGEDLFWFFGRPPLQQIAGDTTITIGYPRVTS